MGINVVKNEIRKWIETVKEKNVDMREGSKSLTNLRMLAKLGIGLDVVTNEDIRALIDVARDKGLDDFMRRRYLSYLTTLTDKGKAERDIIMAFIEVAKNKNEDENIRRKILHSLVSLMKNGKGLDAITEEDIRTFIDIANDKKEHEMVRYYFLGYLGELVEKGKGLNVITDKDIRKVIDSIKDRKEWCKVREGSLMYLTRLVYIGKGTTILTDEDINEIINYLRYVLIGDGLDMVEEVRMMVETLLELWGRIKDNTMS